MPSSGRDDFTLSSVRLLLCQHAKICQVPKGLEEAAAEDLCLSCAEVLGSRSSRVCRVRVLKLGAGSAEALVTHRRSDKDAQCSRSTAMQSSDREKRTLPDRSLICGASLSGSLHKDLHH